MAQPGGSNSSEGRSAYKEQRKHDYRGRNSSWSTFTSAWLHFITLTTHITWFVSVFCDDCSVSSTLRCRLILKFLSRWASFCCTSRWWNDSLGNKVFGDNALIYMYNQAYYKYSVSARPRYRGNPSLNSEKAPREMEKGPIYPLLLQGCMQV